MAEQSTNTTAFSFTLALSIPRQVTATVQVTGPATAHDLERLKWQIQFLIDSMEDAKPCRDWASRWQA